MTVPGPADKAAVFQRRSWEVVGIVDVLVFVPAPATAIESDHLDDEEVNFERKTRHCLQKLETLEMKEKKTESKPLYAEQRRGTGHGTVIGARFSSSSRHTRSSIRAACGVRKAAL